MIVCGVGRREQGKTTVCVYVGLKYPILIAFDPRRRIRLPGSWVATTIDELDEGFGRALGEERGSLRVLVFSPDGDIDEEFDRFCRWVRENITEQGDLSCAVLFDEMSMYLDPRGKMNRDLRWMLQCIEVDRVCFLFTGHRPSDVPTSIRAIADKWIVFRTTLQRDLDVIEDQCGRPMADAVTKLPPRVFMQWDEGHGIMKRHSEPERWYVNLGTPGTPIGPAAFDEGEGEEEGVSTEVDDKLPFG